MEVAKSRTEKSQRLSGRSRNKSRRRGKEHSNAPTSLSGVVQVTERCDGYLHLSQIEYHARSRREGTTSNTAMPAQVPSLR